MGNIILLDDLTINKIAAGEVIERPASVIKELVENSIDAGATNITVEFKNGGISYIRVIDNGKGIMPDDMEIAFERHATSKIRVADDLQVVKSMGFRGEALASIAAISKVTMQSKTMDQDVGYKIVAEGGNVSEKEEVGCQNGTIIEVENLFYNTPVRYKFLRKDFTEAGYIEDVITRIALVHPEISIKLINTGKTIIQTTGNDNLKTVVYSIYGKDIAENIINVNYEYEDIRVTGVIGRPEIARSNRSNQLFFVNSRYVKDKILTSSAEQAFKDKIPAGKFGFLILNIEVNPSKVDVNVHPAKLEVRFEEEQKIFKAVYHAIKDELLKAIGIETKDELQMQNETIQGFETNKIDKIEEKEIITETELNNTQTAKEEIKQDIEESMSESRGLFKKFFKKQDEPETPTMIEEIYQTRRMNIEEPKVGTEKFDSIMKKMAEMRQEVNEFKGVKYDEPIVEEKIPEQEQVQEQEMKIESEIETQQNEVETIENIEKEEIKEEIEPQVQTAETIENNEIVEEQNNMQETMVITDEMKQEIQDTIQNQETQVIDTNEIVEQANNEETQVVETQVSDSQETQIINTDEINKKAEEIEPHIEMPRAEFVNMYSSIFGTKPKEEVEEKEEEEDFKLSEQELKTCKNISLFNENDEKVAPNYKYVGIAFSNYIIIELDKEIYIIDQYAANEKIIYEQIKDNYYNDTEKDSQIMLLPDIIDLTSKEMDIARENVDIFEKAGFILEEFGENTIKLIGVPSVCMELDTKELFIEILNQINKVARTEKEEIEEKFIATLAKNASIDANIAENKNEVDLLLQRLLILDDPFVCKSGRPVAIEITREDIEKKFSRR